MDQVPHPGEQPGDERHPERGDPSHLLDGAVGVQAVEVEEQPSQGPQPRSAQQPHQGPALGGMRVVVETRGCSG